MRGIPCPRSDRDNGKERPKRTCEKLLEGEGEGIGEV